MEVVRVLTQLLLVGNFLVYAEHYVFFQEGSVLLVDIMVNS